MTNKHLNDTEIQQYLLEKTNCDIDIIEHIRHCAYCKLEAEQYALLFEGIKQQENPIFDFNLADLIIEQLPKPQSEFSGENSFFYFIFFIAIFFISILLYLFGNNLLSLFLGIKPILISLIITTVISILVFLGIDMYRKYKTQMKSLNFY